MDITNAVGCDIATSMGKLELLKLLGKGKSGYSYLAQRGENQYVVKLMHYEPCPYYSFGDANKVELEVAAYEKLQEVGINVPTLLEVNAKENYLVKEFIDGSLVTDLIVGEILPETCVEQVCNMASTLQNEGLNIDYFPDNFVLCEGTLYYVDYEHNPYDENWNLINWGLYYWANSQGMKAYRETKDPAQINIHESSGIPIKAPFEEQINQWISSYV